MAVTSSCHTSSSSWPLVSAYEAPTKPRRQPKPTVLWNYGFILRHRFSFFENFMVLYGILYDSIYIQHFPCPFIRTVGDEDHHETLPVLESILSSMSFRAIVSNTAAFHVQLTQTMS